MHRICLPLGILFTIFSSAAEIDTNFESTRRKRSEVTTARNEVNLLSINDRILQGYHLQELPPASIPLSESNHIELVSEKSDLATKIPADIGGTLITYLQEAAPAEPFSCISFVERMLAIEGKFMEALQSEQWRWARYNNEQQVLPGSVILLFPADEEAELRHVAIKLADNLYLSKAGSNVESLMLADVETMRTLWNAPNLIVVNRLQVA